MPSTGDMRRVALQEQVVQRVVDVGGKPERVVVHASDARALHPELILDLLPGSHDVHDARYHDPEDLPGTRVRLRA